jgi:hypothetical protein
MQETEASVSIHQPPGSIGKALVVDTGRQHPLPTENTVPRWYYPRHLRTIELYRTPGGPDTQTKSQSDTRPWRVRAKQQTANSKQQTPGAGDYVETGKSVRREITGDKRSPVEQYAAMNWAQRLKRVFNIDMSICEACGGTVKVIASIEDPVVIKQILTHLQRKAELKEFNPLSESRAPPQKSLFG